MVAQMCFCWYKEESSMGQEGRATVLNHFSTVLWLILLQSLCGMIALALCILDVFVLLEQLMEKQCVLFRQT